MHINKNIDEQQSVVSETWNDVWKKQDGISPLTHFRGRLFVDGYATLKKYIPNDIGEMVEIGAGTGRYALKLAQDLPKSRVLITDITEESLRTAERFGRELGLTNIRTQKEDITKLSFPDSSIEAVMMDCVIPHVPDYELAVSEVSRVLKNDGLLVMAHVNPLNIPHTLYRFWVTHFGKGYLYGLERAFTRKQWRTMCEKNNLKIVATDGFSVGYGIYRHKNKSRIFGMIGRIINRISKIIDRYTNQWCSRTFGFETVTVAIKQGRG